MKLASPTTTTTTTAETTCTMTTTTSDPRYTFTDSEREAVIALKAVCDDEGIYYKDLFELAKYVLVVESSFSDADPAKASQKRLKKAVSLIKKRNEAAKKYQLDGQSVDPFEAVKEIHEVCPNYFVNCYSHDSEGHVVVGHHHAYAPTEYFNRSKENTAKFMVQEQFRHDMGAVNLEEARKGMCLVSITDGKLTVKRALRYLRMLTKGQEMLQSMHPNRMKKIHSQVPSFLAYLVPVGKALLPKKIADRLAIYGTMEELENNLKFTKNPNQTALEWAKERHTLYMETVEKLTI